MFNLLFKCAHYTLLKLAKDDKYLGGTPGITSILHTNGQDLSFHPHIHSIVSGGGLIKMENGLKKNVQTDYFSSLDERWKKIFLKQDFCISWSRCRGSDNKNSSTFKF
ncbi:MAG: transposase [Saprospiraceae bacterium]|nr:transposase [Saprospiraceae bacterium]